MFQQAYWLAQKELKSQRIAIAMTILATILGGLFVSHFLDLSVRSLYGAEEISYNFIILDIFFLMLTPSLSTIFMSKPYISFETIKDDPYSKRIALFRSLPISLQTLSLSRTLIMLITLVIMSVVFYSTITVVIGFFFNDFFQLLTPVEYVTFIIFWFGYSLVLGGLNPYIEYGTNGKVLHIVPWLFIVIFFFIIIIYYEIIGQGIVESFLDLIKNNGWIVAGISFVIGVFGCYIWNILLTNRLARRDYL